MIIVKIVTVNINEEDIDKINKLVGDDAPYPSRSELMRSAVREFLLQEFKK